MQENIHDGILLKGLAEGNERIYDYLFHLYYSGLVVYAMKIVVEKNIAEDIVQDFFYKLWREKEKIVISQTLKSYFFISVKNSCLDFLRHQKVQNRANDYLKQQFEGHAFKEYDFLIESELRELINNAIEKLPEKCKKVFIMNRFEGLKPIEISEKENISVRTVEGHISKALKLLRIELQPYLPEFLILLILTNLK